MHATTEPIPLAAGYTPVFVKGSGYREHLVELYVTGHDEPVLVPRRQAATLSRATAIDRIRSAGAGGTAGGCGNGGTANPSPPPFTPAPSG
jgi:hypothetical protein